MSHIDRGDDVIAKRASDAVGIHKAKIAAEFVAGARARGHSIRQSDVKSVTFKKVRSLKIEVEDFHIFPFVVEQTALHVHLDSLRYINNTDTSAIVEFDLDTSTTDTFSWVITSGTKIGQPVKGQLRIDVPETLDAPIHVDIPINPSLMAVSGTARTITSEWRKKFSHEIAPRTQLRRDVYGLQVAGYAPYKIKARASGRAEIVIEFTMHGRTRKHVATIILGRLLGEVGTSLEQLGRIDGVQGYDAYFVDAQDRPLTVEERTHLPNRQIDAQFSYDEFRLDDETAQYMAA